MVFTRNRPDLLEIPLSSVCGSATLRSEDGHEISVPVVSLLATSSLMRSLLSDLHPALQSPPIFSCACSAEILVTAGKILTEGLVRVKDERLLREVQGFMELLGVEIVLSCKKIEQEPLVNDDADAAIGVNILQDNGQNHNSTTTQP